MKVTNSMFWFLLLSVIVALPSSGALAEDQPPGARLLRARRRKEQTSN